MSVQQSARKRYVVYFVMLISIASSLLYLAFTRMESSRRDLGKIGWADRNPLRRNISDPTYREEEPESKEAPKENAAPEENAAPKENAAPRENAASKENAAQIAARVTQELNIDVTKLESKERGALQESQLSDYRRLWHDRDTGRVVRYINSQVIDVPESATYDDGIQREKAIQIAREVTKEIGTPEVDGLVIDRSNEFIQLVDIYNKRVNDLQSANWVYFAPYMYEGIRVVSGAEVHISGYDATLVKYSAPNFEPPEDLDAKVGVEDAIKAAYDSAGDAVLPSSTEMTASLVLVEPRSEWSLTESERKFEHRYVLCWDVTYETLVDGHEHSVDVFVRASDGSIATVVR